MLVILLVTARAIAMDLGADFSYPLWSFLQGEGSAHRSYMSRLRGLRRGVGTPYLARY
jgi:hypothetical protein